MSSVLCLSPYSLTRRVARSHDKIFTKISNLKRHKLSVHEGTEINKEVFHEQKTNSYCDFCEKVFSHLGELERHIESAHLNLKCKFCGKSFSNAQKLKTHKHRDHEVNIELKKHNNTVHEGHKAYDCNTCGKSFTTLGNLKKHIHIVHEGHKDYNCDSCGKQLHIN